MFTSSLFRNYKMNMFADFNFLVCYIYKHPDYDTRKKNEKIHRARDVCLTQIQII